MKTYTIEVSDAQVRFVESIATELRCTPGELMLALSFANIDMQHEHAAEYFSRALVDFAQRGRIPDVEADDLWDHGDLGVPVSDVPGVHAPSAPSASVFPVTLSEKQAAIFNHLGKNIGADAADVIAALACERLAGNLVHGNTAEVELAFLLRNFIEKREVPYTDEGWGVREVTHA